MEFESLGIFETNNVSSSLVALGAMQDARDVKIIGKQLLGEGIVSLFILGDLGAIKKAFDLGAKAIGSRNEFRGSHIIPLPHQKLFSILSLEKK